MLVLCALAWLAGGIGLAILAAAGEIDLVGRGEGLGLLLVVLTVLFASVLVYCYETVPTGRRGQTFGKQLMDISVIRWLDPDGVVVEPPQRDSNMVRWAIPHGAAVAATILSIVVIYSIDDSELTDREFFTLLMSCCAFVATVWAVCYLSSLFDKNGRGWHDKAAGTIVVVGGALAPVEAGDPDRSPPSDRQGTTKRAPDTAASEAGTQDEE